MRPSTRIRLRVNPGARHTQLVGRHGDGWRIRVAAPADAGRANAELVSYLATLLGVGSAAVRVVAGHHSRDKLVEVSGLDLATLEAALEATKG